jgi:hypothetical protein
MKIVTIDIQGEKNFEIFKYILNNSKDCKSIHDLACGHGNYSIIASDLGFIVNSSDARDSRVPFKEFKTRKINFKNTIIEFVEFTEDIINVSGIFYHLDISEQIILLNKIKNSNCKKVILNTHYYNDSADLEFENKLIPVKTNFISGAIYIEGSNLKSRPLAAYHNRYSFWHDLHSLEKFINSFGFDIKIITPELTPNRSYFELNR